MPSTVDINLKWSEFSKHVSESWMQREANYDFCDVTLVSEDGQKMKAHKIILANSSSILRSILMDGNNSVSLIYLRGVKFSALMSVLDFIYHGETDIKHNNLEQFMNLAEDLKIKGLDNKDITNNIPQNILNADFGCSIFL